MSDKEKVAQWIIEHGFATGHGDSTEDMLKEIKWQIESRTKQAYCYGLDNGIDAEREACAKVCESIERDGAWITKAEAAAAIRARGDDLQTAIEKGTRAWADVPDATAWVEELRGYDTPEVTPDVDNAYTKLDTTAGVLRKEWVGLTGDEIYECWKTGNVVEAVEAKLKEKNT